jgi:hypothetical protein
VSPSPTCWLPILRNRTPAAAEFLTDLLGNVFKFGSELIATVSPGSPAAIISTRRLSNGSLESFGLAPSVLGGVAGTYMITSTGFPPAIDGVALVLLNRE